MQIDLILKLGNYERGLGECSDYILCTAFVK